ncbi:hypothetical protein CEUSTIGMA_g4149.t1 [Chlamydomonas eustigma]|uniref:Uncharacterized protein n=1 Tax=Chlamydomonas eustigma TaxID=1157962 RepID=A0A250X0V0_9CHLO|nr:hypothetical protein CEUSTIGMA_g4149.t1 [Chlamydomonas eustigma]|eukprot:GAX76703.1 hypothetical protein CEUSTIGMA_g4149.t1 [Chlamydomonas eustigma]
MTSSMTREPKSLLLGTDTFRGSKSLYRTQLYDKNAGDTVIERSGLVRTDSPISGNLLISTVNSTHKIRDPITGTTLKYKGGTALIQAPLQKQQFQFSKTFYLTKDIDNTIQTLRNTTRVSRYTNEKIGTAGSTTGLDASLVA